jgi:hypothetical protein
MKTSMVRILALVFMLGIWGSAAADTIRVVWICDVNEGKTMDDVRAANEAWVKYHTANNDERISSVILTPMIGNMQPGRFIFSDDFPSIEVWNASLKLSETDEGAAIDAALGDAATCPQNSMHNAEES